MLPNFVVQAQVKDWGDCVVDQVPTLKCLEIVFGNILFISSALVVLILFIMLVVGSINYLTSFGNAEKVKKAQGTLKYAVIGFILFLCAYLILFIVDQLFLGGQGKIFNLGLPG